MAPTGALSTAIRSLIKDPHTHTHPPDDLSTYISAPGCISRTPDLI